MNGFRLFRCWFGRDPSVVRRWHLCVILLQWPDAEQEQGYMLRSLANIEVSWDRRHGLRATRYSPNRAEYHLAKERRT